MPVQHRPVSEAPATREEDVYVHPQAKPHIKVAIHGQIYRWLGEKINGGVVLDAGCGEGLGTALLARTADRVIGIDIESSSVMRASHFGSRSEIEYVVMNCQRLAFPRESFDCVVSNALLEYLTDVPAFMREAYRALTPGGIFVCGTKNLELSLRASDGSPLYGNHLQEFTPLTLNSAMNEYFSDVKIYGERMGNRSETYIMNGSARRMEHALVSLRLKHYIPLQLRNTVRRAITGVEVNAITEDDFEMVADSPKQALYIVGYGVKR